ncbi:MAG: hypothetical protein ACYTEG_14385 [Planctomycetota bacterium]
MRVVLGIVLLAAFARAEPLVVRVQFKGKPEPSAFVTWDRAYGGGDRELHFADEKGRVELDLAPGKLTIYACHEQRGIVSAAVDLKGSAEVVLDLAKARPSTAALKILDGQSGEPVPDAMFTLLRAGDGLERNRPTEQKFHPTDRVLGLTVVPPSLRAQYDSRPTLYLRQPIRSDETGRIVLHGLLPGPVSGFIAAEGYAPQWIEGARTVRLRRGATLRIRVPKLPRLREGALYCRLRRKDAWGPAIIGAKLPADRVFEARNLPAGSYELILTSNYPGPSGLAPGAHGVRYQFGPIEVAAGADQRLKLNWPGGRALKCALPAEPVHQVVLRSEDYRFSISDRDRVRAARFPDVPPGRYELECWTDRGLAYRRPVDVQSGKGVLVVGSAPAVAAVHGSLDERDAVAFCAGQIDSTWSEAKYRLVLPSEGNAEIWMQLGDVYQRRTIEVRGETRLDWQTDPEAGTACTVNLIGPDGRPLLGFVEIEGPFPPPSAPRSTWNLRLPKGRYRLRAHARRCEPSSIEVDLTKPQTVAIRLAPKP